ncbi:Adhesin yadA precursor [Buttiauxella agrestis]|uniref:Adhesin yadA n=1 Tax=Buttiauxella agrestis TaxID=82977 RepID=A0A381CAI5_9ENTR|nr:YadA-like family protein [Buttiauxella agrestis]SUW64043.1 Adhesin yadA precursor [Buttiauxella agrestis]
MNKIYRLVWNSAQRAWVVAGEFSAAKGKGKNCPRRLSLKAITAGGLVLAALGTSQLANAYTVAGASLVNGGTAASDNGSASNTAFGSGASATGFRSTAVGQSSNSVGVSSVALGDTATANGVSSIALGTDSTTTGIYTIAIGARASASSLKSAGAIALGVESIASFDGATAIGANAESTHLNSVAIGRTTKAYGDSAVAIGDKTDATAMHSTAIGGGSKATGSTSTAVGWYTQGIGENSLAFGNYSTSSGANSAAIGTYADAQAMDSIAIGNKASAQAQRSIATGYQAKATKESSIATGFGANADATNSIAIGVDAKTLAAASNPNSTGAIAIGWEAESSDVDSTAIGSGAKAHEASSTAIGAYASAEAINSIAVGDRAVAMGEGAIGIGGSTKAIGDKALALGDGAQANEDGSIALGSDSITTAAVATASTIIAGKSYDFAGISPLSTLSIGDVGAERTITNVAAGRVSDTSTDGINGSQLYATNSAINLLDENAVKYDLNPDGSVNYNSVTMGGDTYNSVNKTGGTKITNVARGVDDSDAVNVSQLNETNQSINNIYTTGTKYFHANSTKADSQALGVDSIAVGPQAMANGVNSIAQGLSATANGSNSIAMGNNASATSGSRAATAIGADTIATGTSALALGEGSKSYGVNNISLAGGVAGKALTNTSGNNIAMGRNSVADGGFSIGLGFESKAQGYFSAALGSGTVASGAGSVALGSNELRGASANASANDSIALGSFSVANTAGGITGFMPTGATAAQIAAITATTSTLGAMSIGDASTGKFRQLNGLAAGTVDSDAVNVAQLKGAVGSATADAVMYDPGTNHNSVTLGGTTYDNSTHVGGTTITNVANGVAPSDAVNYSQLTETNTNISNIYATGTKYFHANSTGTDSVASALDSIAIGMGAVADVARSVALGDGAKTEAAVATTGTNIAGTDYLFAGMAPIGTVSIGAAGAERTLTNVAAGRLSATSTDGVNGSQLFATNTAIDVLDQNAVKYDLNPDGTINYNSVTMGGDTYNSVTKTGGTKITNLARGVDDSDAVNVSQLNETNTNVTNIGDTLTNIAGDTSTSYTNVHGTGIRYVRTNEAGLAASDSSAEGQGSTALGYNAVSKGESSLAMGREAQANNADDVALGSGSITDIAVGTSGAKIADVDYVFAGINPLSTVSVGSLGRERTITNVAAGRLSAQSTDAINGSQLFATNSAINTLDKGSVKYEINNDGSVNYNSIKLAGDTYNNVTKTGGTRITNVAYGIDDSDVVNVQQLNDATTNIYTGGTKYFHANSVKADSVASGMDSIAVGPNAQSMGNGSIAMGDEAKSIGNGSMALGQNAQSVGENSVAMGVGAIASNTGDIALGAGSTTAAAVATTGISIAGNHYDFAGTTPTSTLSIGSEGAERTITNVAAGRIDANSTDAVNGSQLNATNQAIGNISGVISTIDKGSVKYETNVDGTVNYNKVVMGGDTYDNSTHTGGTTITNVAEGVNPSDAVNKHQLDVVNNSVTNISNGTDGMFQVNNTSNLPKPKPTGKDAVAGGAGAVASGDNSLALGTSSKATHNNSVALGNNSVTDRDNSVSVGSVGGERQIANVAAGTQGTDAVNVNQLKQGVGNAYNYTDNKFNDLKNMVDDQKDKMSAGISGAMAMASLPQPYQPGASMVSMGGGTYQGESAVALGVSTISDNGKWVTKLSGTTTSQGDLGAAVGVGYQW